MKPVLILLFVCCLVMPLMAYDVPGPTTLETLADELKKTDRLPPSPLIIVARLERRDDKDFLIFRLTNTATTLAIIPSVQLPWTYPGNVFLSAVSTRGMPILPRYWEARWRDEKATVSIPPSKSIEGELLLSSRLRYEEEGKSYDVLLMWAASADSDLHFTPHRRHSLSTGMLTIPKRP